MKGIFYLAIVLSVVVLLPYGFAGNGIGTSNIMLTQNSIVLHAGNSTSINYNVILASGNSWGTTISANNSAMLAKDGITLSFTKSYGDPTFSGALNVIASNTAIAGNYITALYATGDDPTISNVILAISIISNNNAKTSNVLPNTTVQNNLTTSNKTKNSNAHIFDVLYKNSTIINASKGANLSLGSAIRIIIKPGTYALIGNSLLNKYNFSVIDFSAPSTFLPSNLSNYSATGAYAFAVNGVISPSISFVNASADPKAIISIISANNSTTSWTLLGGVFNGSAYINGTYKFPNVWSYPNSTYMVNNEFYKPVMWVFLTKKQQKITTTTYPIKSGSSNTTTVKSNQSANTSNSSNTSNGSGTLYIAIAVIIIVVILVLALQKMQGKQKK